MKLSVKLSIDTLQGMMNLNGDRDTYYVMLESYYERKLKQHLTTMAELINMSRW